ncbi:MAG: restriction endonuclease subunit S [Defluviitaleaceae bacterium]|nr:restriction endonuclease subunit S [Defluviitaleaceae bacterium]
MDDEKKAPEIRFEGHTEPWEHYHLSSIANATYGGGTPSTSRAEYWNGNIPWIQSSDIKEHNVTSAFARKSITTKGLESSAAKLVPANSIAVVTRVGVGKLCILPFEYATSQDMFSLSKLTIDINYGAYSIYTMLQAELNAVQGTSIKGITKDELLSKSILVPNSLDEQAAIGSFFRNLDDTIASKKQQYEQTANIKKAMLEKMFPKNGADAPEIRFEGFAEPWELKYLDEILTVNTGRDYKHLESGEIPVYGTGGYMLSVNGWLSDVDGVGIGRKGTIDKPQYLKAPFWAVDTLFFLTASKDIDLVFLFAMAQRINWKTYNEATSLPSLSKTVIEKIAQFFPSYSEQVAIGNFFRSLDNLIESQREELEKLQNVKSACLSKMLV